MCRIGALFSMLSASCNSLKGISMLHSSILHLFRRLESLITPHSHSAFLCHTRYCELCQCAVYSLLLISHHCLRHLQLLQADRCLLVIDDVDGDFMVYLERIHDLSAAVAAGRNKKRVVKQKIGDQVLLAYDETKRMLAVCGAEKVSRNGITHNLNDIFVPVISAYLRFRRAVYKPSRLWQYR